MRAALSQSGHVGRGFAARLLVLALCAGLTMASQTRAQEIGRLYAKKPPPGYGFVRVAVASDRKDVMRLRIGSSDLPIDEAATASSYRAIPGNQPLNLLINGVASTTDIVPRAEGYSTVVVWKTTSGWSTRVIDESQNANDLKARLRFFNLAADCAAKLKLAGGPTIFDKVAFETVQARSINPVTATIEGSCGDQVASITLPQLHAGNYYSLFLRRDSNRLSLTGQLDQTEPYHER